MDAQVRPLATSLQGTWKASSAVTTKKHLNVADHAKVSQLHVADHDPAQAGKREQSAGDLQHPEPCCQTTPLEERGGEQLRECEKMFQPRMSSAYATEGQLNDRTCATFWERVAR